MPVMLFHIIIYKENITKEPVPCFISSLKAIPTATDMVNDIILGSDM